MFFSWNPTAFIELLDTVPAESSEFGNDYCFEIRRGGLTLFIGINESMGDCSVSIHCAGQQEPVFRSVYLGSLGARVVSDKHGNYIELGAPGAYEGQYDSLQPLQQGLRIRVEPHVSVETFGGA